MFAHLVTAVIVCASLLVLALAAEMIIYLLLHDLMTLKKEYVEL